jgi:hypothetical protein
MACFIKQRGHSPSGAFAGNSVLHCGQCRGSFMVFASVVTIVGGLVHYLQKQTEEKVTALFFV